MKKKRFAVWPKPATIPEWFTIGCKQQELLDTELFELCNEFRIRIINGCVRHINYHSSFMIAYIVANNVIEKEKKKKEEDLKPKSIITKFRKANYDD